MRASASSSFDASRPVPLPRKWVSGFTSENPAPGIRSRTALYQAGIVALRPVFPICLRLFPALFTSSHILGRAMVRVVQGRATQTVLESRDINRLGA